MRTKKLAPGVWGFESHGARYEFVIRTYCIQQCDEKSFCVVPIKGCAPDEMSKFAIPSDNPAAPPLRFLPNTELYEQMLDIDARFEGVRVREVANVYERELYLGLPPNYSAVKVRSLFKQRVIEGPIGSRTLDVALTGYGRYCFESEGKAHRSQLSLKVCIARFGRTHPFVIESPVVDVSSEYIGETHFNARDISTIKGLANAMQYLDTPADIRVTPIIVSEPPSRAHPDYKAFIHLVAVDISLSYASGPECKEHGSKSDPCATAPPCATPPLDDPQCSAPSYDEASTCPIVHPVSGKRCGAPREKGKYYCTRHEGILGYYDTR